MGMAPPPHTIREQQPATYAHVASKISELSGDRGSEHFREALVAFKAFLRSQEQTILSK